MARRNEKRNGIMDESDMLQPVVVVVDPNFYTPYTLLCSRKPGTT